MAKHRTLDDALGIAVQTGVPLIVRRRCTPHEVAAWTAIRFLMETTDRTAFGSREIAHEMHTSAYPRVAGWIATLVEKGMLEIIGHEQLPNLEEMRPIYRIPWEDLLRASIDEAKKAVAGTNKKRLKRLAASGALQQLSLEFSVIDRSQESCDRSITGPVIDRSQEMVKTCDRSITERGGSPVIDRSQHEVLGRKEGRGEEIARARAAPPGDDSIGAPPPPPDGQPSIGAHPLALWETACATPRKTDPIQLAMFASEHDPPTGGYGWYWVGRAILAATLFSDVRTLGKVRVILDRWRREDSYGSDMPPTRQGSRHGRPDAARADAPAARAGTTGAAAPVRAPVRRTLDYERPAE